MLVVEKHADGEPHSSDERSGVLSPLLFECSWAKYARKPSRNSDNPDYSYGGLLPIKASMPQHIECPLETLEERAPRRILNIEERREME